MSYTFSSIQQILNMISITLCVEASNTAGLHSYKKTVWLQLETLFKLCSKDLTESIPVTVDLCKLSRDLQSFNCTLNVRWYIYNNSLCYLIKI